VREDLMMKLSARGNQCRACGECLATNAAFARYRKVRRQVAIFQLRGGGKNSRRNAKPGVGYMRRLEAAFWASTRLWPGMAAKLGCAADRARHQRRLDRGRSVKPM